MQYNLSVKSSNFDYQISSDKSQLFSGLNRAIVICDIKLEKAFSTAKIAPADAPKATTRALDASKLLLNSETCPVILPRACELFFVFISENSTVLRALRISFHAPCICSYINCCRSQIISHIPLNSES